MAKQVFYFTLSCLQVEIVHRALVMRRQSEPRLLRVDFPGMEVDNCWLALQIDALEQKLQDGSWQARKYAPPLNGIFSALKRTVEIGNSSNCLPRCCQTT